MRACTSSPLVSVLLLLAASALTCNTRSDAASAPSRPATTSSLTSEPVLSGGVEQSSAAPAYPGLSISQHVANWQAFEANRHPQWQHLSPGQQLTRIANAALDLLPHLKAQSAAGPTTAPFQGNFTTIRVSTLGFALQRQSDCSLSLLTGTYSLMPPSVTLAATQSHYEQTLHQEAGLNSPVDAFPNGCAGTTLETSSRSGVYLGESSQNLDMFAAYGYDPTASTGNVLYVGSLNAGTMQEHALQELTSMPGIDDIASGDLNGDGLADVVGIDQTAGSITVWLVNPDGTVSPGTAYTLPGTRTDAAFVADVNGDGKADVVAATETSSGTEDISVLTGNGDGTLNPATIVGTAPATFTSMIAADLRGDGREDIVTSSGLVFLNNGNGTFAAPIQGVPLTSWDSDTGGHLTVGDFNNDGKLDLAIDHGEVISIYLGNGDGTFTFARAYATSSTFGYVHASDLDGDGSIDLYSGLADGGMFFGDDYNSNAAYALMGNGDGTFAGAPFELFSYNGSNLADLNGDGKLDAVGVSGDFQSSSTAAPTFTSYLNDGKGGFTAAATLTGSPVTMPDGSQQSFTDFDSYALGDVNGDGVPDLLYMGAGGPDWGIAIALGTGDGHFSPPTFLPRPSIASIIVPSGSTENGELTSNLRLADFNHDGKLDLIYNYSDSSCPTSTGCTGTNETYYLGFVVELGNGDGTFQAPKVTTYYNSMAQPELTQDYIAKIVDVNGDGYPDLVLLSEQTNSSGTGTDNSVQVMLGKGDGTFGNASTVTTADVVDGVSASNIPVTTADMNGDGTPDIVALGTSSGSDQSEEVAVALGNGDGSFQAPVITKYFTGGAQFAPGTGLAVGDFNGDGHPDVAVIGEFGPSDTGVFLGNGDGTLQTATLNGLPAPAQGIYLVASTPAVAVDFTGSSKPDLLAGNVLLPNRYAASTPPSPGDFTVSANPSTLTVSAGQSGTTTLTITPSGGFNESVSFQCSGLPAGASCSFSPSTVTPSGAAATTTLTINTASNTAALWIGGMGSALASLGLIFVWPTKRRRPRIAQQFRTVIAIVLVGAACGTLLVACGGGSSSSGSSGSTGMSTSSGYSPSTTSMTSTVTVTASASTPTAVSHTTKIMLTVQ